MFNLIILALGIFIGWCIPQPSWANKWCSKAKELAIKLYTCLKNKIKG